VSISGTDAEAMSGSLAFAGFWGVDFKSSFTSVVSEFAFISNFHKNPLQNFIYWMPRNEWGEHPIKIKMAKILSADGHLSRVERTGWTI